MNVQNDPLRGTRFLIIAASLVIIIYGVNQAQSGVALFLVAVFLALLGTPLVLWLEQKRIPSFLAVMIVLMIRKRLISSTNFVNCGKAR